MSSWHSPGDAVLAAQGGCPCVPVSVCECLRVASWPLMCSCPPLAATARSSVGKIPPAAASPCPGPPWERGSRGPGQSAQLSSAQINKLSWRLHSLSFVWLPHRLAPCQNVSCELRKVAENYAVSCVIPWLFVNLTCAPHLVEKWLNCGYILQRYW